MADIDAMLRELEGPTSYGEAKDHQNALSVLEGLEAIGDLRPSEKAELDKLREQSGKMNDEIGRTGAAYRGALQGATFQQADEIYGLFGGDKAGSRLKNTEAEALYPSEYNSGKTAGAVTSGLASGLATGPLATGGTALSTLLRSALIGGIEGGVWGAGGAEGYKAKAMDALKYGGIGAGTAAVVPAAVWGGRKALTAGSDLVAGALGAGNKGRANRTLLSTLENAGVSPDDAVRRVADAAADGQPEFRLMDAAGKAGQRRASGIVRAGDDGAEEIAQFLETRQLGQHDRVSAFVDDAFETGGTTAQRTEAMLTKNRNATAAASYGDARANAGPVDVRGVVSVIDDRLGPTQGNEWAREGIDGMYQKYRDRLVREVGDRSTELSDFSRVLNAKQDLQTEMKGLLGTPAYHELKKIETALDEALEGASESYRFANDNYREASRVIDSVGVGQDMAKRGRATDNIDTFSGMTQPQQRAARIGYGDTQIDKLERMTAPTADRSKAFRSPKVAQETAEIANDPDLFAARMAREKDMWETQNRALGGSRTADNLEDIADSGALADAARAAKSGASGNFGDMLSNAGSAVSRVASGQNPATRALVAQMLMSGTPQKAISGAVQQGAKATRNNRVYEAMLRALLRGATDNDVAGISLGSK